MAPDQLVPTEFDAFYRQHRRRLVAALNASTRCGLDAATDAVDEAFVRALARWRRVSRMDAPAGWVFTVARNQLNRTRSCRSREVEVLQRTAAGSVVAIDPPTDGRLALWDAVAALPERERLAVALRYIGDLPEKDVAVAMDVAPGTVAATLHSARKRLAIALGHADAPPGHGTTDTEVARDA